MASGLERKNQSESGALAGPGAVDLNAATERFCRQRPGVQPKAVTLLAAFERRFWINVDFC